MDVNRCLRGMPDFEAGLQELQPRYQAEGARLQGLADEFKSREVEIAQLDPQSPAAAVAISQLNFDKEAATREAEYLSRRQAAEANAMLDAAVRGIHRAAAVLGEREGYGAVMMMPGDFIDLTQAPVQESLDDLETRWVMWAHPDYDVTDQVLAILTEQQ